MAWLPSYFTDTLSLDLTRAAQVSLIPPAAGLLHVTLFQMDSLDVSVQALQLLSLQVPSRII